MTIPEITDTINALENKRVNEFKEQISIVFANAEAVSTRVAYLFTDPKKRNKKNIVMPWDLYPDIFADEKAADEQLNDNLAMAKHKADMAAFAARWNKQHKQQQENENDGETGASDNETQEAEK